MCRSGDDIFGHDRGGHEETVDSTSCCSPWGLLCSVGSGSGSGGGGGI